MKTRKQERHLKVIWLYRNICDVFCVAFGFGFFFCCRMMFFAYDIDYFISIMLSIICVLGMISFGIMTGEFEQQYKDERKAMLKTNICTGVKRTLINEMYERD